MDCYNWTFNAKLLLRRLIRTGEEITSQHVVQNTFESWTSGKTNGFALVAIQPVELFLIC